MAKTPCGTEEGEEKCLQKRGHLADLGVDWGINAKTYIKNMRICGPMYFDSG